MPCFPIWLTAFLFSSPKIRVILSRWYCGFWFWLSLAWFIRFVCHRSPSLMLIIVSLVGFSVKFDGLKKFWGTHSWRGFYSLFRISCSFSCFPPISYVTYQMFVPIQTANNANPTNKKTYEHFIRRKSLSISFLLLPTASRHLSIILSLVIPISFTI